MLKLFLGKLFFVLLLIQSFEIYAQSSMQDADDFYKEGNYNVAIKKYLGNVNRDPKNASLQYKIAECYLKINANKSLAIPHLLKAKELGNNSNELNKLLGIAYHYKNEFDKAIENYKKYLENGGKKESEWVERQIEMCNNGKELVKNPLNVKFTHLGKEVNSEFPDYYPFIPSDESVLVYTTRRPGGLLDIDGFYTSDIYMSLVKNGKFSRGKTVGSNINTKEDEQCVGLSPDGKKMLVYIDHRKVYGDLYITHVDATNQFQAAEPLPVPINTKSVETSAFISNDESIIVFASQRDDEDAIGGNDIYFAKKLPDGSWGIPQNAGPNINTIYDEDFPQISDDGKTLYFSSQGHNSMGDFDIFVSKFDAIDNKWSKPTNIGYPLNSAYADMNYSFNKNQRSAYVSSTREGGFGDYDIWKVTFNDADAQLTFIKGKVFVNDSTSLANIDIPIEVYNKNTKEIIEANCKYKAKSKKYTLALEPGSYQLRINHPNFEPFTKELEIMDKKDFKELLILPLLVNRTKLDSEIKKTEFNDNKKINSPK